MIQLITPNPNIPCEPGWCLQYVRQAFNQPAVYGTATEAWEASKTQHRDRNFPPGVSVPVWYGIAKIPAGHVVIRMADGSVYSTSDLGRTPHHHRDLADLEAYYAHYGIPLTYRGWTEDIPGAAAVVKPEPITLNPESTTILEDILATLNDDEKTRLMTAVDRVIRYLDAPIGSIPEKVFEERLPRKGGTRTGTTSFGDTLSYLDSNLDAVREQLGGKK